MVDSTYKAARNLMTRVGYDGDNLVTAYSNPAIGRAIVVEWVGNRIGDTNLTMAGEQYAKDIYDLFTAHGYNTLGEYNVPSESEWVLLLYSYKPWSDFSAKSGFRQADRRSVLRRGRPWSVPVDPTRPRQLVPSRVRQIHLDQTVGGHRRALQLVSGNPTHPTPPPPPLPWTRSPPPPDSLWVPSRATRADHRQRPQEHGWAI